ncbi:hypothetical protein [Bifidobacterium saguinibicoloris]|uniref:hypothetical protein n=1 Tax=Bifidobacterium saguinibicoloris TaxID=2834433 RepID=UPI001C56D54B|nr:hypothetical protein [Bifidobacterium saguinibicoloris]MBW3081565.1 hypothetical protein [Bifidobacterium saguinibicoloris]
MTTHHRGDRFSPEEVAYLNTLAAVHFADEERIRYTDEFKIESLRSYFNGESPVQIFRKAGLDSALIGNKRVERCFARWKANERLVQEARHPGSTPPHHAKQKSDVPHDEERHTVSLFDIFDKTSDIGIDPERLILSSDKRIDLRDLIIYQQAMHISDLQNSVDRMQEELEDLRNLKKQLGL